MKIDLATLLFILGIINFLQVAAFILQYKATKSYAGVGWWLTGFIFVAAGFIFSLLRKIAAIQLLMIMSANILFIGAAIMIYIGCCRFFEKKENIPVIATIFIIFTTLLFYFTYIKNDITPRTIIIGLTLSFFSFITAKCIWVSRLNSCNLSAKFNASIFLAHSCFFIIRAFSVLFFKESQNYFNPSNMLIITYFVQLTEGISVTLGLIVMVNQRLSSEMRDAKNDVENIFFTSPNAVLITRLSDGVIVKANKKFTDLTGFTLEESLNKSIFSLNIYKNHEDRSKIINILKEKEFFENLEIQFQKKNGEIFTSSISAKKIMVQDVPHIISITSDITEQKFASQKIIDANQKLTLANKKLMELNSQKDKFFSIIAHDLKTPFTSVLGFIEILIDSNESVSSENSKKYMTLVHKSATKLYSLLENLLMWSRIQKGEIPFNPQKTDLSVILKTTTELFNETAIKKEISIVNKISGSIFIFADEQMLNTIFRNLISNAIKFSYRGGKIEIDIKESGKKVTISVKDQGTGISEIIKENLFRIDQKSYQSGTENEGSTGLGLILCKEFIEKNMGELSISSKLGAGTEIIINFPIAE
ncbi:PAS domain-containing sensor histidine kinase [Candidatus Dependentiae bacterium]|nr:PAS domain-containing sensor histidine kinase [Candidatus Dependentiae bacterium]